MSTSTAGSRLPPSCDRAMRSRVVRLVVFASLLCALLPSALWVSVSYTQARRHLDETGPLLLQRLAHQARGQLEAAGAEIEAMAGQGALASAGASALSDALASALADSSRFEALVAVDSAGNLLGAVGSGAGLEALLGMLEPTSGLESELLAAMQSVEVRKQLGGAQPGSIRELDLPEVAPLALASAPLRGAGGGVGILHGLVSRQRLEAALSTDLAGFAGSVSLVDRESRLIATGGGGAVTPDVPGMALLLRLAGAGATRYALPLELFGWTLVAEVPLLGGLQPVALALAQALVLSVLLVLGLAGLAFSSATRMARPLWSLYDAMRTAAREGEAVEVSAQGARGESESLILGFNAAVRRLWGRSVETERANLALREQNEAFQQQHQTLSKLTVTDSLTKLANRRCFEGQLSVEIKRLSRHGSGLAMLVIDIDDFKKLNDEFGHAAGDEFLRQIARILKENVRATDLVARYGGEEFVVVATDTPLEGAVVLGEKLRTAVAEASFIVDDTMRPRSATISIGAAQYRDGQTKLFKAADAALYRAKAAGKNCVVASTDDDGETPG